MGGNMVTPSKQGTIRTSNGLVLPATTPAGGYGNTKTGWTTQQLQNLSNIGPTFNQLNPNFATSVTGANALPTAPVYAGPAPTPPVVPPPTPTPPPPPPGPVQATGPSLANQYGGPTAAVGGGGWQAPSWGPMAGQPVNQAGPSQGPTTATPSSSTTTPVGSTANPSTDFTAQNFTGMQGGNLPSGYMGLAGQYNNPFAMYGNQNQFPLTQSQQTAYPSLPGTLNSQSPYSISPQSTGAVGGYSPLTMQQQPAQQKMGGSNASMK